MKLTINTQQSSILEIHFDEKILTKKLAHPRHADMLAFIEQELTQNNKSLNDITAIEVFTGPGPFTSLRTGIAVAQSLSFGLGVPINGQPAGSTIEIHYGKEPNITLAKD